MSRILLLLPFMIWLSWTPEHAPFRPVADPRFSTLVFIGLYLLVVVVLRQWSASMGRRVFEIGVARRLKRFNFVIKQAYFFIPAWFAVGVFVLGWGSFVRDHVGRVAHWPLELPLLLIGTFPAFAAWIGMWWAQYPADRAMRELNVQAQLENNLPVHMPPSLGAYLSANLRLQLLSVVLPAILIMLARDLFIFVLWWMGKPLRQSDTIEALLTLVSAGIVFVLAPELLRRVLNTVPMPESPLRNRMEQLCRRAGLRYREILVWRTHNYMGNAMVLGLFPRVRYILLSDLLLETMSDDQILAVFAHELGHVIYHHMAWYVVFFVTLLCGSAAIGGQLDMMFPQSDIISGAYLLLTLGAFILLFGFLSRKFERQADVFAARTIEMIQGPSAIPALAMLQPAASYVGHYGAELFASALSRVAYINNIPIEARNWSHGSIEKRMRCLQDMSADPGLTGQFDRVMVRVYVTLLCLMCLFGVWALTSMLHF